MILAEQMTALAFAAAATASRDNFPDGMAAAFAAIATVFKHEGYRSQYEEI
jgi:hypothetical protein